MDRQMQAANGFALPAVMVALILLGMGLDGFSTSPINVPEVKRVIRSVKLSEAKRIAEKALHFSTGREIDEFMERSLKKIFPEVS